MLELPLFQFPTTVVCVDDSVAVLDSIEETLAPYFNVKCFTNPADAIKFIYNHKSVLKKARIVDTLKSSEHQDNPNSHVMEIDLQKIKNLASLPERYQEISAVVVDYDMPGIDGITFCQQLKGLPIKKILVTSKLSQREVIQAFNSKAINGFATKVDKEFLDNLHRIVTLMTEDYFVFQTADMADHINNLNPLPDFDAKFADFFRELLISKNINEYFLLDKNGSKLLVGNKGDHKQVLVVHTDESLDRWTDSYSDDDSISVHIWRIKNREKIPYFTSNKTPENTKPNNWTPHLHVPQVFEGKKRYYWCLLNI